MVAVAVVFGFLWLTVPVTLRRVGDGGSGDACLTLANQPPADPLAALPQLEHCRTVVPDDAVLLADLGSAYEAAGRGDAAERAYQQAVALAPDDGTTHLKLARRLFARGAVADARAPAEQADHLQPNHPAVREFLAQLDRAKAETRP